MSNEERSLSLLEAEQGLMQALEADEFDDTSLDVLDAWLQGAQDKRDAYVFVAKRLEAEIESCREYAKQVDEIRKRTERALERLKARARYVMETTGQDRLQGKVHKLWLQKTPGQVVITDFDAIPEALMRVKREADKAKIRQLLKDGHEVPGADMTVGEQTVRYR